MRVRKLTDWIGRFGWPIIVGCIGVLVGLAIKYPADWNPPDATLNLLGGAVGSVGSVAAALLSLQRQVAHEADKEAQRAHEVRRKLGRVFALLLTEIELAIHKVDGKRNVAVTELADRLGKLTPILGKYEQILPSQMEAWMAFDEQCVMFFETTRVALQALAAGCERLQADASKVPMQTLPPNFKANWEELIAAANELLEEVVEISGDHQLRKLRINPRTDLSLVLMP